MNRVTLDPHAFFRRIPPLADRLRHRLTATADAIVVCHLGVPRIERKTWSLTIDGLVGRTLMLRREAPCPPASPSMNKQRRVGTRAHRRA
ncbi:MAG: hypothetical protein JO220_03320 [Hyphomicrobiales bacterium]|nr:hypothetical protein [Hyphomicrobiales bacterium]